ncbi:MAG: MFS transporter [Patescibacteria group bacterium]
MAKNKNKNFKNIFLLGLTSFFNDISGEIIRPILPLFLSGLGAGGLIIGFIGGLMDSISSIVQIFSGFLSDKLGKRKFLVVLGYALSSVVKLLLAAVTKVWQAVIILPFERIGKGIHTPPRDAIISESAVNHRGRGFGIHRAMDNAGAILGSVIVFFLVWLWHLGYGHIFLIGAIASFVALIPLIWVKEKKKDPRRDLTLKIGFKKLNPSLRIFIAIATIFSLANINYMLFLLKVSGEGATKLVLDVILFYILYSVVSTAFSIPAGILSDKFGRKKMIVLGYLIFNLAVLGFAIFPASNIAIFIILFVLYGLFSAFVEGNQRAFVSDLSEPEVRATALGTYHTMISLAALPASLIAGLLWDKIDASSAFIYAYAVSFIAIILFLIFRKKIGEERSHRSVANFYLTIWIGLILAAVAGGYYFFVK